MCNVTIPPSGNTTPPVVVLNCSFYKVCRQRSQCPQDQTWWSYWVPSGNGCGCGQEIEVPVVPRFRICNASDDASFDSAMFLANSSYYLGCDCAIFMNCTNETVTPTPPPPIVPVPPLPPSGSSCNYSCEDILALHVVILNLTDIVTAQQNDIDMLIGVGQNLSARVTALEALQGNWSSEFVYIQSEIDAINAGIVNQTASNDAEFTDLYSIVNNITGSCANETILYIQDNGQMFGNNWWFGAQGDSLFAIDITQSSYYRFQSGVNVTL